MALSATNSMSFVLKCNMHREKKAELQFDNVAGHFLFYFIANRSNKYGIEYMGKLFTVGRGFPFASAYFSAVRILVL